MREFWGKRGIELSDEQFREAVANVRAFFELLADWDLNAGVTTGEEYGILKHEAPGRRECHENPEKRNSC